MWRGGGIAPSFSISALDGGEYWTALLGITASLAFCPTSGILTKKKKSFGNWICFIPHVTWWKAPTLLGPSEVGNFNHWTFERKTDAVFVALFRLDYRMMGKFQKLSNPRVLYTSVRIIFWNCITKTMTNALRMQRQSTGTTDSWERVSAWT
jgi:hypothetical protein